MPYLMIESKTTDGKKFRPSDWIERLASDFGEFGEDHRLRYSIYVRPASTPNGERCLVLDVSTQESRPDIFNFVMDFARANNLYIH